MRLKTALFFSFLTIFSNFSWADNKLDINSASMGEIAQTLNPIAEKDLCHLITKERQEKGPFQNIEALKNIKGIDEKTFQLIKDHVVAVQLKK